MHVGSPFWREAAKMIAALGFHVIVFDSRRGVSDTAIEGPQATTPASSLRQAGIEVVSLGLMRGAGRTADLRRSRRALRSRRFDGLLIIYGGWNAVYAWFSGRRPYYVYLQGSDVHSIERKGLPVRSFVLRRAARVWANGDWLTTQARSRFRFSSITSLVPGIETDSWAPSSRPKDVTFVCGRAMSPVYDNECIVRALRQVHLARRGWTVVFAAAGPSLGGVIELADRTLLPEDRAMVSFRGGMHRDEFRALMSGGHVYVSMSTKDGTSTTLLEALSCGLIPVASDIPPNREWIFDGGAHGYLVPVGDDQALTGALVAAGELAERAPDASVESNRRLVIERADMSRNLGLLSEALLRDLRSSH